MLTKKTVLIALTAALSVALAATLFTQMLRADLGSDAPEEVVVPRAVEERPHMPRKREKEELREENKEVEELGRRIGQLRDIILIRDGVELPVGELREMVEGR